MLIESKILYFYSNNCKVCKDIKSDIDEIAQIIPILYVNNDEKNNKQLSEQFLVDYFPTISILTVENGILNYVGKKEIKEFISLVKDTFE